MSELKPEELASMAKEFSESVFGKWLLETRKQDIDTTLRGAMNTESSDSQLKALNYAAGVQSVTDLIDQLVYLADHPEVLKSTLKQQP